MMGEIICWKTVRYNLFQTPSIINCSKSFLPSSRSEVNSARADSGIQLTILRTVWQTLVAAVAGYGPNVLRNWVASLFPTLSTDLKTSNKKAAPHSTVSSDSSEPTVKKKPNFSKLSLTYLHCMIN